MNRHRFIIPLVFAVSVAVAYCGWRRGIPALMQSQHFSGSRDAPEGRGWSNERRMQVSEERARSIREAVMGYRTANGELPKSLDSLVPAFLASVPEPATTTMPFELIVEPGGKFRVCWEPWPNTSYERFWVDQDGKLRGDT